MNKNNSFVAIADSSNKLADISAEFEIGLQIVELRTIDCVFPT